MPDEFEISKDSDERARNLADKFRTYAAEPGPWIFEEEGTLERVGKEWAGEAPVGDVVDNVRAVSRLIYFAGRIRHEVPVVNVTEVGMIPVIHFDYTEVQLFGLPFWLEEDLGWWRYNFQLMERRHISFVSPEKALNGFYQGLWRFLSYRMEGFSFWCSSNNQTKGHSPNAASGGPPPPGAAAPGSSGFYIKLSCLHHHLAAYASPAYALTWRNLGSFTTPAYGVLPAGAWIFGAQGGLFPRLTHDPTPVHVPPTFTPSTTCF